MTELVAPKKLFLRNDWASRKMLKISVGVETESCLQASMLKDIVQQKERLFASWPFLLLKNKSQRHSPPALMKKNNRNPRPREEIWKAEVCERKIL